MVNPMTRRALIWIVAVLTLTLMACGGGPKAPTLEDQLDQARVLNSDLRAELDDTAGAEALGPLDNFILSLGAGLYEELVFRLIFLGGAVLLITKFIEDKKQRAMAIIGAVIFTSLVFSGIHYVGSMADTFTMYSFSFRFLAGVIFAVLFYARGFAVAVYTHAIYDVIVLVF